MAAAGDIVSPGQAIVLHDFHGTPTGVAPDATAFVLRETHFVAEAIGSWDGRVGADGSSDRAWVEKTAEALSGLGMPGGYTGPLGPT